MAKKKYVKPTMNVVKLEKHQVLLSGTPGQGTSNPYKPGGGKTW